jgi:hypothetical protein
MDPLHLPDVSEDQPEVDWQVVADRNGGAAIIRAMYGAYHVDDAWYDGARRDDAHHAGIEVLGIYHYLAADQEVAPQAEAYVRLLGSLRPGEFAILDLEVGDGDQLGRAEQWFEYVDEHLTYPGYTHAWLYSDLGFLQSAGLMPVVERTDRHIWVADYSVEPQIRHTLWQHTDSEIWPGIPTGGKGNDCSIFHGDADGLHAVVTGG